MTPMLFEMCVSCDLCALILFLVRLYIYQIGVMRNSLCQYGKLHNKVNQGYF